MNSIILLLVIRLAPLSIPCTIITYIITKTISKSKIMSVIMAVMAIVIISIIPIKCGTKICQSCGTEMGILETACPVCKEQQSMVSITGVIKCPKCENLIDKDSIQCKYCGCKLYE